MKKLFALFLALVLVLSFAACGINPTFGGMNGDNPPDGGNDNPGASQQEQDKSTKDNPVPEGNDAEFTIYVNGSEEWTPFSGKSGVTFSVADENLISVSDNGKKISFTGKQVGETVITATLDGAACEALVRVRAMKTNDGSVALKFVRPERYYAQYSDTANYPEVPHTKYFVDDTAASSYPIYGYDEYGLMGGEYDTPEISAYLEVGDGGSSYYMYWQVNERSKEHKSWETALLGPVVYTYGGLPETAGGDFFYPLNEFAEAIIVHAGHNDIRPYLVEGEHDTILGIECDVYYVEGNTAIPANQKFWVDPETHNTLRIETTDTNGETKIIEVLDYDMDYDGDIPINPFDN